MFVDQEVILTLHGEDSHPDGIAVDSAHRTIYWTDTGLDHICKAGLDGGNRSVIISKDLDEPRDIAVDSVNG